MAKATLPTNFKDDIMNASMNGKRRYRMTQNADGTVSFDDATTYDQVGNNFGGAQINQTNTAVNASADASKIIDSLDAIKANTQAKYMAGALAVKELNNNLGGNNLIYNESEDAYYIQHGADAALKKLGSNDLVIPKIETSKTKFDYGYSNTSLSMPINTQSYKTMIIGSVSPAYGSTGVTYSHKPGQIYNISNLDSVTLQINTVGNYGTTASMNNIVFSS